MAFLLQSMDVGQTPPIEYRQATAEEAVVLGEAAGDCRQRLADQMRRHGKAGVYRRRPRGCAGHGACGAGPGLSDLAHGAERGGHISQAGQQGDAVRDGLQVTATTDSGVATIVDLEGTAVGRRRPREILVRRRRETMAYCTVSIGSGLVDSLYGKSQFPIKSYLETKGEAFEQRSILKKLFRMETSKHWAEQYTGETAADDFEPVGEGGNYPETGFEEGFPKAIVNETWKSSSPSPRSWWRTAASAP